MEILTNKIQNDKLELVYHFGFYFNGVFMNLYRRIKYGIQGVNI